MTVTVTVTVTTYDSPLYNRPCSNFERVLSVCACVFCMCFLYASSP